MAGILDKAEVRGKFDLLYIQIKKGILSIPPFLGRDFLFAKNQRFCYIIPKKRRITDGTKSKKISF